MAMNEWEKSVSVCRGHELANALYVLSSTKPLTKHKITDKITDKEAQNQSM